MKRHIKMMRRFSSLALSIALLSTVFYGCGSAQTASSGDGANASLASTATPTSSQAAPASSSDVELVVASVNNNDMVTMSELSPEFTKETGIKVKFTILSENEIRSKITQDVGLGGGQYDLVTLGTSDSGTYLDNGWVEPLQPMLDKMSDADKKAFDVGDIFDPVKESLSSTTKGLACLPFYSESTLMFYNKDIFAAKNLAMPTNPTWDQIYDLAKKANDPAKGISGIALRGLPGYGENMYIFGTMVNAFGGQYYDKDWNAKFNTPEMKNAFEFYKKLMTDAGETGATTAGYTECLNLMSSGKAAMWYDASVSAGTFANSADSKVKGKIGYAMSPTAVKTKNTQTIGGWGMGITSSSKHKDEAFKFLTWATSKDYVKLVGEKKGWTSAPSGTRKSTYDLAEYKSACDFADITKEAIMNVDYKHPAVNETPYVGNSLPCLPEYSSWGETCAQQLAAYLSGQKDVNAALAECQKAVSAAATDGGYKK